MRHARTSEQPESRSLDSSRLTREQVVDRIMPLNPSARHDFLGDYEDDELDLYLQRLTAVTRPRGRFARWERQPGPGISTRQADSF
jgi:hypothetical protein